jgi:hypothetical protein
MPSNSEEGSAASPATGRSRTFRLFVSSTFQDLKAERNALHEHVFPRLRELCRRPPHHCRFQAIDLRWGVSEEAALDQQTMTICLGEIERCHRVTPRPNFLVLLGDRYGWRPPPPRIPAEEFEALLEHVTTEEAELLRWREEQPDDQKGWYRLDENANPTEYRLQPRHVDLSGCETREEKEAAQRAEAKKWSGTRGSKGIEDKLHRALESAAENASLRTKERFKYETSATEQEIAAGALEVENPEDKIFCFFRSLSKLPDSFELEKFLDLVESRCKGLGRPLADPARGCVASLRSLPTDATAKEVYDHIEQAWAEAAGDSEATNDLELLEGWLCQFTGYDYRDLAKEDWRPDAGAEARLNTLKEKLRQRVPANIQEYKVKWTEDGPSTDHLGTLPDDLDACLALLDVQVPPETLCDAVWRRLAGMILEEINDATDLPAAPDEEIRVQPDNGLDPEGRAHCDFANKLLRFFVGREKPLEAIHAYLKSEERNILTIVAEGGAGKSALMAKALEKAKKAHSGAQIVYRFIGTTPSSSVGRSLLESLCREISRRYGQEEKVPYDYTELVSELEKRMEPATADRPLILFLDALDQLSEADGARNLTWLPRQLPESVRVVVSTRREAETFMAVTRLQPEEVELGPMKPEEGDELLGQWLDDSHRRLQPGQRKEVLKKFKLSDGRPLYLKLAFEEARRWTSYDHPQEALEPKIPGIIRKNLFDRLIKEDRHGEELVSRALGYLAASRYGLAEDELLDVLSRDRDLYSSFLKGSYHLPSDLVARAIEYRQSKGLNEGSDERNEAQHAETWLRALIKKRDAPDLWSFLGDVLPKREGPRLPVVLWSRLFFDLAPYLTERMADVTPLLAFYHRELRDVGAEVYAHDESGQVLHCRLADYFRSRADPEGERTWTGGDVRGLSELPYHLTEAADWQEVHNTLTDFRFLEHKAAEVGVEKPRGDGEGETVYTGVFQLQQDYEHALQRMPGGGGGAGQRRPLIVTAVDFGEGYVVRCPWCNTAHAFTEERRRDWLGEEIPCPNEECSGLLKVNPFICERPSWAK